MIKVQIIKNKNLAKEERELINRARVKEWGIGERKDFSKDFEPETKWFFFKDKDAIVALGALRPIKITYLDKKYNILGISSIISLEKGKGYGKLLIKEIIDYLKKKGKTGLGFTIKTEFFKKAGLKTEKDFIKRFIYKKPNGEEIIDNEGDGIYFEGKDRFISRVLKNKSPIYIDILHW